MKIDKESWSGRRLSLAILLTLLTAGVLLLAGHQGATADVTPDAIVATVDPVSGDADIVIVGASAEDHLSGNGAPDATELSRSRAIATGDFNNDGASDIIIGAPDADVTIADPASTRADAGIAYIIFGRTTPFTSPIDTSVAAQTSIRILGREAGDRLGFAVATGDVNGDNIDDILLGAPGADFNDTTRVNTGAVFVIHGSATLATGTLDLNTANVPAVVVNGVSTGDAFGSSIAVANVGGLTGTPGAEQGIEDVLVGAPGNDGPTGARAEAGAAYLLFGGPGFTRAASNATRNVDIADPTTPANAIIFGQAGDQLGASVALGDVNAGAARDLIVGAPGTDRPEKTTDPAVPAANATGAIHVVFGGSNLNPATGTSKVFDTGAATPQQSVTVYGASANDHLGFSVAAGDVTSDGIFDLVGGAPNADGPGNARLDAGEAYVLAGGDLLSSPTGVFKRLDLFTIQPSLTVFGLAGDRLGSTVATGSVNLFARNDVITDLLIGSPGASSGKGAVSVIFGGANLSSFPTRDILTGQDDLRFIGDAAGDELGWGIATGDIDENTGGDLIIGAPFADVTVGMTTRTNAGEVYVFQSAAEDVPPINQNPTVTVTAPNGGETVNGGSIFNITWTATDPNGDDTIQRFEIRLSTDGGATFPDQGVIALTVPGNVRTFAWAVPIGVNTNQARIRITAFDNAGGTGQDDSNNNFTISDVGQTVLLNSPNGGENLIQGQVFNITWTVPEALAPQVRGFDLFLSTDGGATFNIPIAFTGPTTPALAANVRSFAWTVPAICTTTARVQIAARLFSGLSAFDSSNNNFSISAPGPTLDLTDLKITTNNTRIALTTDPPATGPEVLFAPGATVQLTDATGTFHTFGNVKIKKGGRKLITKGSINGMSLDAFFPNGATRTLRIVNPTCGITQVQVMRNGTTLTIVSAASVQNNFN